MLFTEAQIQAVKSIDLLTYLQTYEPENIRRSGANEYCLAEHDSLKISNGKWFWHSRGFGGYTAYQFLIKVRGMDFRAAVQTLIDGRFAYIPTVQNKQSTIKPKEPLLLPTANKNNDAVYAYLQGRGVERGVIKRCIENGSLYEASKTHHCVFVGFDGSVPKYACIRATIGRLKQDVKNSDKRFAFVLPPKNTESRNLTVCESAIDILSHASLYEMSGKEWDGHGLSLGGVNSRSLINFLERHTEIEHIYLSLDNDKAGKDATDRIIKELLADRRFSHIKITVAPPPMGKDFNDTVQAVRQLNQKTVNRSKEADFLF